MNVDRSSQHSAIVIRVSPFGEHHAMVDLLTPGQGLLPSVAYGLRGRRSSLRGKVVPFARGTAWLYRDPRQERSKITDFDVERYALNLSANLDAYYEASLWAEVIWRSHASGDGGDEVFALFGTALDLLDDAPGDASVLGSVVLWRYLEIMGLQPDEADIPDTDPRAVRYLNHVSRGTLEIPRLNLSERFLQYVRRFVVAGIQDALGVPLNTLKVSGGLRGISSRSSG